MSKFDRRKTRSCRSAYQHLKHMHSSKPRKEVREAELYSSTEEISENEDIHPTQLVKAFD